jgi:hypothetical protein
MTLDATDVSGEQAHIHLELHRPRFKPNGAIGLAEFGGTPETPGLVPA